MHWKSLRDKRFSSTVNPQSERRYDVYAEPT
ncbi:unknown (plasmid) [Haloarcula marismortui ATCC 43049]|uniref:Uncharacterized protein n=1 Tax=Haloarcula marismortui (strain ATCC 43049 / DSM 3752 / JCM 8966 / VKM B-1809) TaxID=272569 RepID=Q5V7M9_HALMA|nr:unknown [Haloarcula marismortui ATCC 43049]